MKLATCVCASHETPCQGDAPGLRGCRYDSIVFILFSIGRQALSYLDLPEPRKPKPGVPHTRHWTYHPLLLAWRFVGVYGEFYAYVLGAHLLLFCSLIGVIAVWFVLATVLDPSAYLPFGVAAVTCTTVVTTMCAALPLSLSARVPAIARIAAGLSTARLSVNMRCLACTS